MSALHAWPGPEGFARVNFAPDLSRGGAGKGTWARALGDNGADRRRDKHKMV